MKHKIVLINPPTTNPYGPFIYFPMALVTLGGVLKKLGVKAELWDFDLYFKKVKNTTEDQLRHMLRTGIKGASTNIFGISSICSNFPMAIWIAKEIKSFKPDALVILGGPQPSSVPKQTIERFEFVDAVVSGEGEPVLEDMVRIGFDRGRFADLPGVTIQTHGKVVTNGRRALVDDMDQFPFPDFSLLNFQDYIDHQIYQFVPPVEVGRGCPFTCTFCSTALMWERDFRVKSPQRIFAEMKVLHQQYGFTQFDFIHDNFTTSKKFVSEFCGYMEVHNKDGLAWHASSRTDCIDPARLKRMYAMGCRGLFFGVESGSERIQKAMKKNLQLENFEPTLKTAAELGMNATTAFILGFPEETEEDIDATVRRSLHYRHVGAQRIFFTKLTALTGTSIYKEYVDRLTECSQPSTLSEQKYGLPFVENVIRKYPDLFSSYYHVPHPKFTFEYLCKFIAFAHQLVNGAPKQARTVMENLDIGATKLFSLWDSWATRNKVVYWPYEHYTNEEFQMDFPIFLKQVIFSHGGMNSEREVRILQEAI